MKKIMVSLVSVAFALLPFNTASAYSHANRYGGSTSHSYGSTSHSSAYGTSSSHTYGEGSSHTNEYGGSTSHSAYGGTSHTNAYGGTTSGEAGYGATHTDTYGATAYHPPADELPSARSVLSVSSADDRGLLRSRMLQLRFDSGRRRRGRCGRRCDRCGSGSRLPRKVPPPRKTPTLRATTQAHPTANAAAANANAAAANANAAAANANAAAAYAMGAVYGALPAGCITPNVSGGGTYYLCGNTWFSPAYGANGVHYTVVPAP